MTKPPFSPPTRSGVTAESARICKRHSVIEFPPALFLLAPGLLRALIRRSRCVAHVRRTRRDKCLSHRRFIDHRPTLSSAAHGSRACIFVDIYKHFLDFIAPQHNNSDLGSIQHRGPPWRHHQTKLLPKLWDSVDCNRIDL